ncbi:MAG: WYL domain-containing protein [Clostridiales bacterium 43-6]|nr:MAG: WYL domain-containing protein [Clostridiales bacterium 43-6]
MPKGNYQKLKLLYLMKILQDKTDEEHTMTVNEMIEELSQYGISAERKSIYDDLEILRQFGLDIAVRKSKTYDYFIASREFELPELKLLADAVASSKFITVKKSNELIKKIEGFAGVHQAKKLQRQVFVTNRVKTMNEQIYYNVDTIHTAIAQNKQIAFKYFQYTVDKEKQYRREGEKYIVSPYALSWDDENYYLIGFYEKYNDLSHFRVDKMEQIEITLENRMNIIGNEQFNVADYSKKVFSMFSGQEQRVKILFQNSLINVVIDRFGKDIFIEKINDIHFAVRLDIAISPTFFGWLFQFGNKAKIISPPSVIEEYKTTLLSAMDLYE